MQLKRSRIPRHNMSSFYTACILSVLTYAAPAFFYALPKYVKDELVRVKKRAMSIICPGLPFPIVDLITGLCSNTFDTIVKDPEQRLNRLIQFSAPSRYALRCNRRFIVPKCKTDRFGNSFIIYIYIYRFLVLFSYFLYFYIVLSFIYTFYQFDHL